MKTITEATIYWDTTNEGWAFRIRDNAGHTESGAWDAACDGSITQLEEAVVSLCYQNGVDVQSGQVACEPDRDGGCASYRS